MCWWSWVWWSSGIGRCWRCWRRAPVTEVARRYGVARQTVHEWLRRYAARAGWAGLADRSSRPASCPHQMPAVVEARIVALRREHPGWGPSRIRWQLERDGRRAAAGPVGGVPGADPPWPGRGEEAQAAAGGLPAVGAGPVDGAVADGRDGPGAPGRRRRRSRSSPGSMTTPGSSSAPRWWRGRRPGRCARRWPRRWRRHGVPGADPDRQRQGLHGAVRAGPGAGDVRPDLRRQRDPAPADRAVFADHDREGGAAAQDDAGGVLRRQ